MNRLQCKEVRHDTGITSVLEELTRCSRRAFVRRHYSLLRSGRFASAMLVGGLILLSMLPLGSFGAEEKAGARVADKQKPVMDSHEREFMVKLKVLRAARVSDDNREDLIKEYRQLIATSEGRPYLGRAMYDLGKLYSSSRDQHGKLPEAYRDQSLHWYRRAIAIADANSPSWVDASLALARELRSNRTDQQAIREARAIIERVLQDHAAKPQVKARANAELVLQCLVEGKYSEADVGCRELLNWSEEGDAGLIERLQQGTFVALLNEIAQRKEMDEDNRSWIDGFVASVPARPWMSKDIERFKQRLPSSGAPSVADAAVDSKAFRTVLVAANGLVFLVIGLFLIRKKLLQRRPRIAAS